MRQFMLACFCVWTSVSVFSFSDFAVYSQRETEENEQIYQRVLADDDDGFLPADEDFFLISDD
ncbi:MAG: hypothetical protein IJ852_05445 [Alphaproteobacteria bacterium]|nr:hypothetical protein [Alphaproteobacteria bacterium]